MNETKRILLTSAELHSRLVTEWLKLPVPSNVVEFFPTDDQSVLASAILDTNDAATHWAFYNQHLLELDLTEAPFDTLDGPNSPHLKSLLPEAATYYLGSFLKFGLIMVLCNGIYTVNGFEVALVYVDNFLRVYQKWDIGDLRKCHPELFKCLLDVTDFLYSCPVELTGLRPTGPASPNSIVHYLQFVRGHRYPQASLK